MLASDFGSGWSDDKGFLAVRRTFGRKEGKFLINFEQFVEVDTNFKYLGGTDLNGQKLSKVIDQFRILD